MIEVTFHRQADIADHLLKFAVIAASYSGKWIFCRHKARDTYEIPGGHREKGENINATASRELYEETGALDFSISPVCVYSVAKEDKVTYGMLFTAEVKTLGKLPEDMEMAEIIFCDTLPDKLTHPLIQPKLLEYVARKNPQATLLFGTGNEAKLAHMRKLLAFLPIELLGLNDMDISAPNVAETGNTPLENARLKAMAYYETFKIPVFSCDSGLYFDNVPDEIQPGVHVRTINGQTLTDEEMTCYYAELANKYGDLIARYKNAIFFVKDEDHIYESMDDNLSGNPFIITSVPHKRRENGFPLDCLSKHIPSGVYYYDMENCEGVAKDTQDGFREFFSKILL